MLFGGDFDLENEQNKLLAIEEQLSKPEIWEFPKKMTGLLREKSVFELNINNYKALEKSYNDVVDWLALADLAEEEAEKNIHIGKNADTINNQENDIFKMLDSALNKFDENIQSIQLSLLLADENDVKNAILEIHPGAGGTEAQDWAEMLERMYLRFADIQNFKAEIIDYLAGDEAGVKSVTIRISGLYAFGFLKSEKGIHRLIRLSPFDTSGKRHTSFASVDVLPDIGDDIQVDIQESDLRIDVYRASGAGGQHVNKTESAVRITHIPTGIVVQCQNEKSQHSNKETAMRLLKSRVYDNERKKRDQLKQADYTEKNAIAFGSQIRTYTMQPYRLVKDHRTNSQISDVDAVLDGKILTFINDYLLFAYEKGLIL